MYSLISQSIVLCLMHKELVNVMVKNNAVILLSVSDLDIIMDMNSWAFRMQKQRDWGYVVCSKYHELDRLKSSLVRKNNLQF